jgi:hypothetical protein
MSRIGGGRLGFMSESMEDLSVMQRQALENFKKLLMKGILSMKMCFLVIEKWMGEEGCYIVFRMEVESNDRRSVEVIL